MGFLGHAFFRCNFPYHLSAQHGIVLNSGAKRAGLFYYSVQDMDVDMAEDGWLPGNY